MSEEDQNLSYLYWSPKLHKSPYKHKFISGSSKCMTKDLPCLLTNLLMHLSIVSTRVQRVGNSREIDRLLLPKGQTFDENIFSQGWKIEHSRAGLTFFSNKCYRSFIMNETCHQVKLAKVAEGHQEV